jgi:tetratricopeptide (TPR) repeat protein
MPGKKIARRASPRAVTLRSALGPGLLLVLLATAFLLLRSGEPDVSPEPAGVEPVPVDTPARVPRVVATEPTSQAPPLAAPSPWIALNDEAIERLTAGDLDGAIERFERCLAAEPGREAFRGNLAEALVRSARQLHDEGDLAEAVTRLERALELAPGRDDSDAMGRVLARWRDELELGSDDWTEDSERFELSFDTDRRELLHHSHEVLEHLELSYDDLVRWFVVDPFPEGTRLRVVLYEPDDFDRLTGLGDWAAGVFDGVVRVSITDLGQGRWRSVLVHELVHAFVQALGPGAPGWLNEGLAQLLENRPQDVERARAGLRGGELFPLDRLAGTLTTWDDAAAIGRAYAQSLVFVADLAQRYGDESLRRMVLGIGAGRSVAESFQAWTGVPVETAFADWSAELGR